MAAILQQVDHQLEQMLASWNIYTTVIALVLVTCAVYPLFFDAEPDIHPLLLARQSAASHVRQPGESAVFRSLDVPPGYPLRTGLNVKDPGAPKWTSGRDGDLRDVWKRAVSGPVDSDGKPTGEAGKVLTVLGKQEVIEYSFEKLSGEIIAVGQHMRNHGGNRIAVYLPNSVELLVTLFDLPAETSGDSAPDVLFVTEDATSALDTSEVVSFTQKNIVAAIGAQIAALPRNHRLAPTDLLMPLASLTDMYPLTVTLAALFSNSSLALTPVSGPNVQYGAAFQGVSPTIVIAGTQTMSNYCRDKERNELTNHIAIGHWWKSRSLAAGVMPKASATGSPRLVYTYDSSTASTVPLNPTELFNLRLFTGARIVYAFTDSRVAGAVSQTNALDYAKRNGESGHFGPPLSCVELKLKDTGDRKSEGAKALGQLVVSGPAVVGGEVVCGQIMMMTDENTLAYPE
ncbi:hypothetical protein P7C71_g1472, partial [Lecanoromycetidae sp. Uapishka_2]